jgi:hypothetical protein
MSAAVSSPQSELLTSWKEIALYLGKGVRTVQRWEQQFALPVRRPNEKAKGIVHATRSELDAWLERQWSQRPMEISSTHPASCYLEVLKNLREATELRKANRLLLADVRSGVSSLVQECHTMARHLSVWQGPRAE